MCGICGFASKGTVARQRLCEMNDTLRHRGPDDAGIWMGQSGPWQIGLAHRRLSILDLSEQGHQPMLSRDGRYILVFNGEIYNFQSLREQLSGKGYTYRSDGDTEVLLTAWQAWGEACVERIDGMFAFAVHDRQTGRLFFARDRVGKKPLYYYHQEGTIVFASELKAILLHPAFRKEIETDVLSRYLCNLYIESPATIYRHTYKLEPGHCMVWENGQIRKRQYYSYLEAFEKGREDPLRDPVEAQAGLSALVAQQVASRLTADVPVGVFLSGGVDSTLVAAHAARLAGGPLRSFTIGFHERERDEAEQARAIAQHIGTEHVELYAQEAELLSFVEDLPRWYDEPFADASQIPTMLVSKLARQEVAVALSGDGGDEFFCGYNLYDWVRRAQQLDGAAGVADKLFALPFVRGAKRWLPTTARALLQNRPQATKVQLFTDVREEIVRELLCVPGTSPKFSLEGQIPTENWQEKRMLLDIHRYLPDDVLTKVDRASMKYSLEVRAPLLDPAIGEYSFRLSHGLKYRHGEKKWILKQAAYELVPQRLLDMPKKGFGVPLAKWLRGPLAEKVRMYADPAAMARQGIFRGEAVARLVRQVEQRSSTIYCGVLWAFVVFQMWYQMYIEDVW